jgi:hypothetical protein
MIISDGAEIRGISEWSATHARIMPQRLFMGNNSHFPVLRLENMGQEDGRYFLSYILPSWSCRQEIKSLFKRGYGSARLDIAPAPFAVRLWGAPENVKSDISELQNLLDTMKGNLHAAPIVSIERYSQKRK